MCMDAAVPIPPGRLYDSDPGLQARQRAFRGRLRDAGLMAGKFASPERLELLLLHALKELGNADNGTATAGRAVASQRVSATPPEVAFAILLTPFVVRGQDVQIEWQIENATHVTISAGGQRLQVEVAGYQVTSHQVYTFRADESGPVSIKAHNRFGALSVDLGELVVR
jgi:hypothetical protein